MFTLSLAAQSRIGDFQGLLNNPTTELTNIMGKCLAKRKLIRFTMENLYWLKSKPHALIVYVLSSGR